MKPRHKLLMLIASIFVITGLVVFGWHWGAGQLQSLVGNRIRDVADQGKTITCNNLDIKGFPFRIGLHCSNTSYDDNNRRLGFTAGEFRSTAQAYRPNHVISELDGPMIITGKSNHIEASWKILRSSAFIDFTSLSRTSIEATELGIKTNLVDMPGLKTIDAENLQFHIRQNEENLDFAANGFNIVLGNLQSSSPIKIADINFFATVINGAKALRYTNDGERLSLRGSDITLYDFSITPLNDTKVSLSGPLSISQQGLISGDLNLKIVNIDGLRPFIKNIDAEFAESFSQITQILSSLTTSDTQGEFSIKLSLRNGRVQAGLFPLGSIPAI